MNRKIQFKLVIIFAISVFMFSCKYEKIEPSNTLPENVSFQNDIIPMFNQSCNTVGCHNEGGIPPDLSLGNAYVNLTTKDLIDLDFPENSLIYMRMTDVQSPMPLTGVMDYESKQVLSWVKDGAQDN